MHVLTRYIGRNLLIATLFITGVLSAVILLTQSLRFLDLVVSAGASSGLFFALSFLVLPRFLEIILPLGFAVAILFTYQRLQGDSELVVMKATGASPTQLARPAVRMGVVGCIFMIVTTLWITPLTLQQMQHVRHVIRSEFSAMMLREGVFNTLGDGVTVYVRKKAGNGEFQGLLIHDTRNPKTGPVTVFAKRGQVVITDEGYQVLVYDGARQVLRPDDKALQRLQFNSYSIDLPSNDKVSDTRDLEADEMTIIPLVRALQGQADLARQARVEIHKRVSAPFMILTFGGIALLAMLAGAYTRHNQPLRLTFALVPIAVLQGLYLAAYNVSKNNDIGILIMYGVVFVPLAVIMLAFYRLRGGHNKPFPWVEVSI
ncbi:MAG: LPS export ABC transporter permease LptF [Pseudomonadota bacterium]